MVQHSNGLVEDSPASKPERDLRSGGDATSTRASLLDGWNSFPNLVTYTRIVLVFVFIVLCALAGSYGVKSIPMRFAAAIVFAVAASTDKLDGYLARKRQEVTQLGKLLDPIADKILVNAALILLSIFGELSWIITAIFLIREIGITLMRMMIVERSGKVIPASNLGKYKTFFQCIAVTMLLVPVWYFSSQPTLTRWQWWYYRLAFVVIGIALFYCLYSAFQYVYHAFRSEEN